MDTTTDAYWTVVHKKVCDLNELLTLRRLECVTDWPEVEYLIKRKITNIAYELIALKEKE